MLKRSVDTHVKSRIREARIFARESQADLGNVLGKCRVSVSDLERGRVKVKATELFIIAEHYAKPITYFFPDSTRG